MKKQIIAPTFEKKDFKISRSCGFSGCVQVAYKDNIIGVGDTKNPNGSLLIFDKEEWNAFITGVKNGEFDY